MAVAQQEVQVIPISADPEEEPTSLKSYSEVSVILPRLELIWLGLTDRR